MNTETIKAKLREEVRPHPSRWSLETQLDEVFGNPNWDYSDSGAVCQGVDFLVVGVGATGLFRIDYKVDHESTPLGGIVNDWHEVRVVSKPEYVAVKPAAYFAEQGEG